MTNHNRIASNDRHMDPGDLYDEVSHDDDCDNDECEGECSYSEPDYESILADRNAR